MKRLFALLLLTSLAFAQTESVNLTKADLEPLLGNWSGTLTTLEYSDDTTHSRTDVVWSITDSDSGLVTKTMLWDEGGETEMVNGLIATSTGGKRIALDGNLWVVWAKRTTENGTTIVFQGPGQDNNKNAQITHVLYMSLPDSSRQDSVVLTKKVLYENAGQEIERSQFRLGRVKE